MKKSAAMKPQQKFTTAPKKSIGTRQVAKGMGGMFGNVTPKKPEPDNFAPKKSDTKPKKGSAEARLKGVRL